jgi:hypothetical protein
MWGEKMEMELASKPSNPVSRLWGIIVSPGRTFKEIKEDPRFLIPALLLIIISLALGCWCLPQSKAWAVDYYTKLKMPPDQIARSIKYIPVWMVGMCLAKMPFYWLVEAAMLSIYNQLSVGEARFKQFYALVVYAYIPVYFFNLIFTFVTKFMGFQAALQLSLGPGLLMGYLRQGFLFYFLSQMDIFSVWSLVLLVFGGAVLMNKRKSGLAIYMTVLWLLYVLFSAWTASTTPGLS